MNNNVPRKWVLLLRLTVMSDRIQKSIRRTENLWQYFSPQDNRRMIYSSIRPDYATRCAAQDLAASSR